MYSSVGQAVVGLPSIASPTSGRVLVRVAPGADRVEVGRRGDRDRLAAVALRRRLLRRTLAATQRRDRDRGSGCRDQQQHADPRDPPPGQDPAALLRDRVEHRGRLAGRAAGARDLDLERVLEVAEEVVHVAVAVARLLGGRLLDRRREHRRGVGATALDARHHLVDVLHRDADLGLGLERDLAGQHLVEQDPERVDVGAGVDLPAHRLLGGDVVGGAEDPAGRGQAVRLEREGDPEVGDLGPALGVDEDVLGLDVAVDQPRLRGRPAGPGRSRSRRRSPRRAAASPSLEIRCLRVWPGTYSKTM